MKLLTMLLLNKFKNNGGSAPSDYNAKIYTEKPQGYSYKTYGFVEFIEEIPEFDFTGLTNVTRFFEKFSNLKKVKLKNFPTTIGSLDSMFGGCESLTEIQGFPATITLTGVSCKQTFNNCHVLVDIPLISAPSVTNLSDIFKNCYALSNESLNKVLALCISATNAKTKTLAYLGLSSEQATTCTTLSNWADAQTAGWTTGY